MFVVRFASLIALAVWLGALTAPIWMSGGVPRDLARQTRTLGYVCGGVLLASLFVLKFVGPPPHRFPLRAVLAALMLALVIATHALNIESAVPVVVNIVLAATLLSWHARE